MFELGSGSQLHDLTPGTWPNGLFWTMRIPDDAFHVSRKGRRAQLNLKRLPLTDTFQFGGPLCVASEVDIFLLWKSTGRAEERGNGNSSAGPFNEDAFMGHLRPALAFATVNGRQTGYSFRTGPLVSEGFYANMGTERNGAFLA